MLYTFAANYAPSSGGASPTAEEEATARQFLDAYGKSLPCRRCRESFRENRARAKARFRGGYAEVFSSRDSLFAFAYALHGEVTRMLGKGSLSFSLEEARRTIEALRARDCSEEGCNEPTSRTRLRLCFEEEEDYGEE
ncbi:MAG: ERV1/ALR-related protein [Ilumatobacteraceae bacterium]